jgi:hypothetical protein
MWDGTTKENGGWEMGMGTFKIAVAILFITAFSNASLLVKRGGFV